MNPDGIFRTVIAALWIGMAIFIYVDCKRHGLPTDRVAFWGSLIVGNMWLVAP